MTKLSTGGSSGPASVPFLTLQLVPQCMRIVGLSLNAGNSSQETDYETNTSTSADLIPSAAHSIERINQASSAGSGERTSRPVPYQAEDVAALPKTQGLNLIDAYICSECFAAQTLPSGLTLLRPRDTRTGWRRMTLRRIRCSCCGITPILLELVMRLDQVPRRGLGKDQRGALPFRRCLQKERLRYLRQGVS